MSRDGENSPRLLSVENALPTGLAHLDEREATRAAGLAVGDDADPIHGSVLLEHRSQLGLGGGEGKVSYVQLLAQCLVLARFRGPGQTMGRDRRSRDPRSEHPAAEPEQSKARRCAPGEDAAYGPPRPLSLGELSLRTLIGPRSPASLSYASRFGREPRRAHEEPPHSVVTHHLIDRKGEPTLRARDEILDCSRAPGTCELTETCLDAGGRAGVPG